MRSFLHSKKQGSVLGAVLCAVMVLSAIAVSLVQIAKSQLNGSYSLETRLESERVSLAFGNLLVSEAIQAARNETAIFEGRSLVYSGNTIATDGKQSVVIDPFPSNLLTAPRSTPEKSDHDRGYPGGLAWRVPYSETVRARGFVRVNHTDFASAVDDVEREIFTEATLWRIPAPGIPFLSSRQPLVIEGLSISVNGTAVILNSEVPAGLASTFLVEDQTAARITAGNDPGKRFDQIYQNSSVPGSVEIVVDNIEALPAGFSKLEIGGKFYAALNLNEFRGPASVRVFGGAIKDGFAIIGSNVASDTPISISVDGPVILSGSNLRYAIVATSSNKVAFQSRAIFDTANGHFVSPLGDAINQLWTGHVFVSVADPEIILSENWSSRTLTLMGSLHVIGGAMRSSGVGSNTLMELTIVPPDWNLIRNPFTFAYRHESVLSSF